jgi:cell wall-associated NlpC family hydrolase
MPRFRPRTSTVERPQLSPLHLPPAWIADYLSLSWKEAGRERDGADCWGVLYLVLRDQFGIVIPRFDGVGWKSGETAAERQVARQHLAAVMADEQNLAPWSLIWDKAAAPADQVLGAGLARPGDCVHMRMVTSLMHVGVVVAPGWMLHIEEPSAAILARGGTSYATCAAYDDQRHAASVQTFYRWKDLAST